MRASSARFSWRRAWRSSLASRSCDWTRGSPTRTCGRTGTSWRSGCCTFAGSMPSSAVATCNATPTIRTTCTLVPWSSSPRTASRTPTVPIAQTMAVRYQRLRREGFVSELFALERERDRIEREQDLRAQAHTVRALHASLEQATRQHAQVVSNHRRQLHGERAETNG